MKKQCQEQKEQNCQIDDLLSSLQQFLVINELCKEDQDQFSVEIRKNQYEIFQGISTNAQLNLASYTNLIYLPTSLGQIQNSSHDQLAIQQVNLAASIKNSHPSQDLQNLFKTVYQLPKLRYQQSSKLFNKQNSTQFEEHNKILEYQNKKKLLQQRQQINNLSTIKKNADLSYYQGSSFKTPKGKYYQQNEKSLDELNRQQNQQFQDITWNILSQKSKIHLNHSKYSPKAKQSTIKSSLRKQRQRISKEENRALINEALNKSNALTSQQKANQQKNFYQNYFSSAKNRILDINCTPDEGFNCCQGLFFNKKQNQKTDEDQIKGSNIDVRSLKLLKESQRIKKN